jgi:hypothetical protein
MAVLESLMTREWFEVGESVNILCGRASVLNYFLFQKHHYLGRSKRISLSNSKAVLDRLTMSTDHLQEVRRWDLAAIEIHTLR